MRARESSNGVSGPNVRTGRLPGCAATLTPAMLCSLARTGHPGPLARLDHAATHVRTGHTRPRSPRRSYCPCYKLGTPRGPREVRRMIDKMDSDRDCFVDLTEFAVA